MLFLPGMVHLLFQKPWHPRALQPAHLVPLLASYADSTSVVLDVEEAKPQNRSQRQARNPISLAL